MPMEVDRRQFLQLAGANAAALALGPIGAAAPRTSEKVGQTQTDIELFDVQCGFGGMTPGDPKVVSVEELVTEMGRLRIGAALVHTAPEDHENDAPAANEAINAACKSNPSLIPCPIVMPGNCGGLRDEKEQVAAHVKQGCGAVIVRPSVDYWIMARWACDALFSVLQERRVPVYCREGLVSLDQVGDLAGRYPSLPLIITKRHYRMLRMLLPLMKTFPNVYLAIGSDYTAHRGIEQFVATLGAKRLLFGTGFPEAESMSAVTQLMYAEISDEQKRLIGAGNLKRLISEIKR